MKRKLLSKVFTMLLAGLLIASSISLNVFANESEISESSLSSGNYNVAVSVAGSGSSYNNISGFYDKGNVFTINSDGSASLKYNIGFVSTGNSLFGTYKAYDSNVYYYKVNESDEWKEVASENMTYGSTRATSVEFLLEDANISEFYIKADIFLRGSDIASGTYVTSVEGTVTYNIESVSLDMSGEDLFFGSTLITLKSNRTNSTIYYTIDGVEYLYEEPIEISKTTTISAYAKCDGYLDSEVVTNTYRKSESNLFGSYNKEYSEGEHAVTLSIKKEGESSESSYASLVSTDATLIVDASGNGSLLVEFKHGTMMSMDCYLEDITYFDLDNKLVSVETLTYFEEESYINSGAYPSKTVLVPLVNKKTHCVPMNAQAGTNSWYVNYHDFDIWINEFNEDAGFVEPESDELPEVEDTGFKFGSDEVELSPGKYVIDASFVKSNDHSELSMSNDAVYGDYILHVKNDGSTTVSLNFGGMEYGGIYSYVDAFRYYTSDTINPHYLIDATINSLTTVGTPNNVTVDVTNKALDGMYVNFDVLYIHTGLDAYMTLDYSTATPYTGEASFVFGSDEVELKPGKYLIDGEFVKSNNFDELSMSNDAVYGSYILEVKNDGSANVSLNFGGMEYGGIASYVETFRYYTSATIDTKYLVESTVNSLTSANTPNNVTVNVSNNESDGMYVNFDVLYIHTGLDAYLKLDYSSATNYEESKLEYELSDTNYSLKNGGNLEFRILADFETFIELKVNGSVLATSDYSIREGSIIVEVFEDYLATLSTGNYTFDVLTTEGVASVSVDIEGSDGSVNTSDINQVYLYVNLIVFSLITLAALNKDKIKLLSK